MRRMWMRRERCTRREEGVRFLRTLATSDVVRDALSG
jgi:hypothetical protein